MKIVMFRPKQEAFLVVVVTVLADDQVVLTQGPGCIKDSSPEWATIATTLLLLLLLQTVKGRSTIIIPLNWPEHI